MDKSVLINIPSIEGGIKITKEMASDDSRQYICIREGHAIIHSFYGLIIVGLKDYFENHEKISDAQSEGFQEFMDWMEGKNFSVAFWKRMVGLNNISVKDDETIRIENESFSEDLIYNHKPVLVENLFKALKMNISTEKRDMNMFVMDMKCIDFLVKTIGKIAPARKVIYESVHKERPVRFTLLDMHCVFGILSCNVSEAEKEFNFKEFKDYADSLDVQ